MLSALTKSVLNVAGKGVRSFSSRVPINPTAITPKSLPSGLQLPKAVDIISKSKRPSEELGYFPSEKYIRGLVNIDGFEDVLDFSRNMPRIKDDGSAGYSMNQAESDAAIQAVPDLTPHIVDLAKELEVVSSDRQQDIIDTLQLMSVHYAWIWQQQTMLPLRLNQQEDGSLVGLGNSVIPKQVACPNLALAYLFNTSAQQGYSRYSGPNMFVFPEDEPANPSNVSSFCYLEGNPRDEDGRFQTRTMTYQGESCTFKDNAEVQFQINHGLQELHAPKLIKASNQLLRAAKSNQVDYMIDSYRQATQAVKPMTEIMRQMFYMSNPDEYVFLRTWLISAYGREQHFPDGLVLKGAGAFGMEEVTQPDIGETGAQASKQLLCKELAFLQPPKDHPLAEVRAQFFASQDDGPKRYAIEVREALQSNNVQDLARKTPELGLAVLSFLVAGPLNHQLAHSEAALRYIYKAGDLNKNSGGTAATYLYSSLLETARSAQSWVDGINVSQLSSEDRAQLDQVVDHIQSVFSKTQEREGWIRKQLER